jgi:simple sugar transport system permease protein
MPLDVVLRGIFSAAFLASVIRISTPLILPALGGLISDLAGVINIALEGIMLVAAFTGVVVSAYTQNLWLGLLSGILSGVLVALVLAYFHLYLGTDIILAGIAINIMAQGGTIFLLYTLTGDKGNSSTLPSLIVPNVTIPFIDRIPGLNTAVSGHNVFVYLAFILTWVVSVFLYRTRLGTHTRAVGENAEAAGTVGINVRRTQMIAIGLSGFFAALGGLSLSMAYLSLFQSAMTAGRGFIALAAVFLGGRKPWGTLFAALIFGFAQALSNHLGSLNVPPQLVQMIPYAATIIALVVYNLRKRAQANERARRFQERHMAELSAAKGGQD